MPAKAPHKPTAATRRIVKNMAMAGMTQQQICAALGIGSRMTLGKHYRKELDQGGDLATAEIAAALFKNAKAGNVTAQIFWMKTRAGWREKSDLNLTSEDGSMTPVPTVVEVVGKSVDQSES